MSFLLMLFITFNSNLETYQQADQAIFDLVSYHSGHPLVRNPEKRFRTAVMLVEASRRAGVPWQLVEAIALHETAFRHNLTSFDGKGSKGYMQIHGAALKHCRELEDRKISMKNKFDQFLCGSHWIKLAMEKCGSIDQGLALYATGYMCDYSKSKSVTGIVRRRMKVFQKLVDNYGESDYIEIGG